MSLYVVLCTKYTNKICLNQKFCCPLWPLFSIYMFHQLQFVSMRAVKALVNMCICAVELIHFFISFYISKVLLPFVVFLCFVLICFTNYNVSMRAPKALVNMCICAGSPEPSLLKNVLSVKFSCAGSLKFNIISNVY